MNVQYNPLLAEFDTQNFIVAAKKAKVLPENATKREILAFAVGLGVGIRGVVSSSISGDSLKTGSVFNKLLKYSENEIK